MSKLKLRKIFSSIVNYFLPKIQSSTQNLRTVWTAVKNTFEVGLSLLEMGYIFDDDGKLKKFVEFDFNPTEPYNFYISKDPEECQAHYEEIGDLITNFLYHGLVAFHTMKRLPVPKYSTLENGTFIFATKKYELKDILIILIQGSGVERAGQWSRDLIINDCMSNGSQLPYVKMAARKNYGMMILNPNDNVRENNQKIPHSGTAEEHAKYVWENYVKETRASKILIVAHSFGGIATIALADQFQDDFEQRVIAIAMADSLHVHSDYKVTDYLKKVSRNWIASTAQLDTPINTPSFDITRVSAGHPRHEMTSASCINSVFKFFDEKIKDLKVGKQLKKKN